MKAWGIFTLIGLVGFLFFFIIEFVTQWEDGGNFLKLVVILGVNLFIVVVIDYVFRMSTRGEG